MTDIIMNERANMIRKSNHLSQKYSLIRTNNKLQFISYQDVNKHETFAEISDNADKTKSEEITLNQCFECFMTAEILGKDNAWYCRK